VSDAAADEPLVVDIAGTGRADLPLVGGKAAHLGELTRAGVNVPPAFVVTVHAYSAFIAAAGIEGRIFERMNAVPPGNQGAVEEAYEEVRALFASSPLPDALVQEVARRYADLGGGAVAVRSSATAEDLEHASFAGQQQTFLNVEGAEHVAAAVRDCWASLFEPRAVVYRRRAGVDDAKMAVVVQRMVQADRSGVLFTINPVTADPGQVVIEAVYGLGETLVSGMVTPDTYVVDKASGRLVEVQVAPQERQLVPGSAASALHERNAFVEVEWARRARQKLSDEEIRELAGIGLRLEEHFGAPQDIEWATDGEHFYVLQSRPVTTIGR
jgi:pyruvate,water dikinase